MKRKIKRALCLLLVTAMSLSLLTACRPSDALTRWMYIDHALDLSNFDELTQKEEEEDHPDNRDPVEEHRDDAKITEEDIEIGQLMEELFGDEEKADEALQALYSDLAETDWGAQYIMDNVDWDQIVSSSDDENSSPSVSATTINGIAQQVITTSTAANTPGVGVSAEAVEGDVEKENSVTSGGSLEDESEHEGSTGNNTGGPNEGSIIDSPDDGEGGSNAGNTDNEDSSKQAVDDSGTYNEPEEHEAAHVAATGELAIAVSMLAGEEVLCATSTDYKKNEWVQKIFQNDTSVALWTNASAPLSDRNFQDLMNMNPDLLVEISGENTFTESQIDVFLAADENNVYAALPGFNSAKDTEETIEELGTLLGEAAEDKAEQYITWCGNVEDNLKNISSTATTVYIEGYDSNVEINVERTDGSSDYIGSGMAYIRPGTGFRSLDDYLGYAKVSDFAEKPYRCIGTNTSLDYWGSTNEYNSATPAEGDLTYISPLKEAGSSSGSYYLTNMKSDVFGLTKYNDYHNGTYYDYTFSSLGGLGQDSSKIKFKTVIAADSSTKSALEKSWSWGFLKNENDEYWETGVNFGYSLGYFGAEQEIYYNGNYWPSHIVGEYEILVQPRGGMGNWINGSPESILESVWTAWAIQDYYNESRVKTLISQFYSQFYDYNLNSSELSAILAGN